MHSYFTTALPLLSILPSLITAKQVTGRNACQIFGPTSAYAIFSDQPTNSQDLTFSLGDNAGNTTGKPFDFEVSKGTGDTDEIDLVVFFTGLPCSGPGPFSFEFNFDPANVLVDEGQGQINMFRVDASVQAAGAGAPTWNSVGPATGSLIGTFELPMDGQARVLYLNQLVCQPTIVLRFGITRYSSQAGTVAYVNANGFGLRERNGC